MGMFIYDILKNRRKEWTEWTGVHKIRKKWGSQM